MDPKYKKPSGDNQGHWWPSIYSIHGEHLGSAFFISLVHLAWSYPSCIAWNQHYPPLVPYHWSLTKKPKVGKTTHQVCSFEDDIIVNTSRVTKVRTHAFSLRKNNMWFLTRTSELTSMVVSGSPNRWQVACNPPSGSIYHLYTTYVPLIYHLCTTYIPLIYHLYIATWGIICYLPPFGGTRNNHW